jgi:hypothetical protein
VDNDCRKKRRYTKAQDIEQLAVRIYRNNGRGITINDLFAFGVAVHKTQAQNTLKHSLKNQVLFTISNYKPQHYYPTCIRAVIFKNKFSNASIRVTGVGFLNTCTSYINSNINRSNNNESTDSCSDSLIVQSLEGYVLPLLPSSPLHIHKMQFKLKIIPDCYHELYDIHIDSRNKGKEYVEIIGNVRVSYHLYSNGTIMVFTESSNNPYRLADDNNLCRLFAFFGQVRDRLVILLRDEHERLVPDVMEWQLTQFDINKDIKVSDWFQYTGTKTQIKHWNHIFRIYIKSIEKDTVCRVESSNITPNKSSAIDTINNIFNPIQRLEKQIEQINRKLDLVLPSFSSASSNGQMLLENMPASKATFFDKEHGAASNVPQ